MNQSTDTKFKIGDIVRHDKFGEGVVIDYSDSARGIATVQFKAEKHPKKLIVSISPMARIGESPNSETVGTATDNTTLNPFVEVAFVYQGNDVETVIARREDADKHGRLLVQRYYNHFKGVYDVREIDTSLAPVISMGERRKKSAKKQSRGTYLARPYSSPSRYAKQIVKVTHHFEIVR